MELIRRAFDINVFGIGVATINSGFFRTGFNETGSESYQQWSSRTDPMVPMPPAGPVIALQHDPQPMIDAMVDVIPDKKSFSRTIARRDQV